MVEAALVFPLVLLTVLAMVYYMVFMYAKVSASSGLAMQTLAEAGRRTETCRIHSPVPNRGSIDFALTGIHESCLGQRTLTGGAFRHNYAKTLETRSYVLDEKTEIRISDFLREAAR